MRLSLLGGMHSIPFLIVRIGNEPRTLVGGHTLWQRHDMDTQEVHPVRIEADVYCGIISLAAYSMQFTCLLELSYLLIAESRQQGVADGVNEL